MWFWAVILVLLCDAPLVSMAYGEVISVTAKKERDREAILKMAGCFAVDFHFEETIVLHPKYQLHPTHDEWSFEAVIIEEDADDVIRLQHVLETPRGVS